MHLRKVTAPIATPKLIAASETRIHLLPLKKEKNYFRKMQKRLSHFRDLIKVSSGCGTLTALRSPVLVQSILNNKKLITYVRV